MRRFLPFLMLLFPCLAVAQSNTGQRFSYRIENFTWPRESELFSQSPGTATDMKNFDIVSNGTSTYLRKREGYQNIIPPVLSSDFRIAALYFYKPLSNLIFDYDYLVAISGTKLLCTYDGQGIWDTIVPGLGNPLCNSTEPGSFVTFKDTLILSNPVYDSIYLFGPGSPVDLRVVVRKPCDYDYLVLHQDRIYMYGSHPNWGWQNKILWNPEFDIDFDSIGTEYGSGFVYVNQDDGDVLMRVEPLGPYLIAYKEHAVYRIALSPETNAPYSIDPISTTGLISRNAVANAGTYHVFVAIDGVYTCDGSGVRKISQDLDYWFRDSLASGYGKVKSTSVAYFRNKFYVTLPKWNGTSRAEIDPYGHRVFVYDPLTGSWLKYIFGDGAAPISGISGNDTDGSMPLVTYTASSQFYSFATQSDRLFFVLDSAAYERVGSYPSGNSDSKSTIPALWTSGFLNIGPMSQRKEISRVLFQGANANAGTSSIALSWWADNATSSVSSTALSCASTLWCWDNERVSPTVAGTAIMMKLALDDSLGMSIYGIELEGVYKGPADE